jgi:hypothetical protein
MINPFILALIIFLIQLTYVYIARHYTIYNRKIEEYNFNLNIMEQQIIVCDYEYNSRVVNTQIELMKHHEYLLSRDNNTITTIYDTIFWYLYPPYDNVAHSKVMLRLQDLYLKCKQNIKPIEAPSIIDVLLKK